MQNNAKQHKQIPKRSKWTPKDVSFGQYSQISKIANSNLRLGSLADRSFGANAGWFGKRFHKILDPRIDVILGVGEIVAHVRSFAGRGTLVDRSIFAYLYE